MINIFFILIFVTAIAAVSLGVRYTLHMFQQSSYQYRSYWRYMKTHPAMTLLPLAGVAVLAGWLAVRKSLAAVVVILSLQSLLQVRPAPAGISVLAQSRQEKTDNHRQGEAADCRHGGAVSAGMSGGIAYGGDFLAAAAGIGYAWGHA